MGDDKPSGLDGWYDAVAEYGSGGLYANEAYEVLESGASARTSTGEVLDERAPRAGPETGGPAAYAVQGAGRGRLPGRYLVRRQQRPQLLKPRPGAAAIDMIVVHVARGTYSGTLDWFRNPDNTGSSAHYTVSKYGAVGQSVRDEDIAWHAGWWKTNKRSMGVEHAGNINDPDWFTSDTYNGSAKLSAWLSRKHGVPVDRRHIIGHHEVAGCSGSGGGVSCHPDPGKQWDWHRPLRLVRDYR